MDSKIQSNGGAQDAGRSSLHEVLACHQFEEEDREAIERVTMLLVEYAWSDDRMSDNAKKLKAAMLKVWEHWQSRQANDQDHRSAPTAGGERKEKHE